MLRCMEYDHVNRIKIKKIDIDQVAENDMIINAIKTQSNISTKMGTIGPESPKDTNPQHLIDPVYNIITKYENLYTQWPVLKEELQITENRNAPTLSVDLPNPINCDIGEHNIEEPTKTEDKTDESIQARTDPRMREFIT